MTRTVTTFFEAADGTEPDIVVEVGPGDDRFSVEICTDLDGVPEAERAGVTERATELYWQAERSAYLLGNPGAE